MLTVTTPLTLSFSVSPSSNAAFNSHNSKAMISEFDSLHSKTGDNVSGNRGSSMTLINNLPVNNLPVVSDNLKKLLGNKKEIKKVCSLKNVSNTGKLNFVKNIFIPGKYFVLQKKSDEKGGKPFQPSLLDIFSWLRYSPINDEAYCMYCVI